NGVVNNGTLTLTNCIVQHNGIAADFSRSIYGGGIKNNGTLTVQNCLINFNDAGLGAGLYNDNFATATLTDTIITRNDSNGIANFAGTLNLNNVYLDHNHSGGVNSNSGTNTFNNVTFESNDKDYGGGFYNYNHSTATLTNVNFY